jgi:hypothetical protein
VLNWIAKEGAKRKVLEGKLVLQLYLKTSRQKQKTRASLLLLLSGKYNYIYIKNGNSVNNIIRK